MTLVGLHHPGTSLLHRIPAGGKFLMLLGFALLVVLLPEPVHQLALVLAVCVAYVIAQIPPARCLHVAKVALPIVAFVFLIQWWLLDVERAEVVSLRILAAIGAANLFTLTTRIDDLITAVERGLRPLGRFGVQPERVGLLVGLTLQAVAAVSSIARETREAQRARGMQGSIPAFAIPLMVRTVRHSDELGEALAARGIGDD